MKTDDLVRALATDLQPVRRLRKLESRALVWAVLALAAVAAGAWVLGPRADLLQKLGDPRYLAEAGVLVLLFVQASRSAFRLSVPGRDGGWMTRALPPAALAVWLVLVAARSPGDPSALGLNGLWCIVMMAALGLAPAVAAFVMLRRAAPLGRGWTGSCALLAAASLAMVGVQALCENDDASHVLVFHVLPVAAIAIVGAAAGRRFFVED